MYLNLNLSRLVLFEFFADSDVMCRFFEMESV